MPSWNLATAQTRPPTRCTAANSLFSVWNFAAEHTLVIVTANAPQVQGMRVDVEIVDGSDSGNVYLSKKVRREVPETD